MGGGEKLPLPETSRLPPIFYPFSPCVRHTIPPETKGTSGISSVHRENTTKQLESYFEMVIVDQGLKMGNLNDSREIIVVCFLQQR